MRYLRIISLVVFFVVAGAVFTHSLGSINQDIGRHLKIGEIIWQTHDVPKTNLFSYTEPNTPFINHHWLSEVVFYLLNASIGLKGLILFKTTILLCAFWLLFLSVSKKVEPVMSIGASLIGLLVLETRTDLRPEVFSFLFLAYFLFAVFKAKYSQKYIWLLATPLIQIIWSNAHIYFVLGPAILGLYAIDRWLNNDPAWSKSSKITILAILATLINPSWIYGALEPFTILTSYGYSIVENQSILFLKDYGILLTQINIFILATILLWLSFIPAIIKYGFKGYFFELGSGLAFTIFGFSMIRNLGPFSMVFIPLLALNIQAWISSKIITEKTLKLVYYSLIVICLILLNSVIKNDFYRWSGSNNKFGLEFSASANNGVDFVLNNKISGPVFNNFDVGSYLIWKLYPEQKVFVDGRPEAYSIKFFSEIYKPMQEDKQTWNHYADEVYKINYVFFDYHDITPWAQTFLSFISQDKNWPMIYKDESVVIFIRRTAKNLPLIQQYQISTPF